MPAYCTTSGVVGWERRSHKKVFERYLFIIYLKLAIFNCYNIPCTTIHVNIELQNLQRISALKSISKGTCSI